MRRVLLLAYPAAWRRRYGAELLDLLEEEPLTLRTMADVLMAGLRQRLDAVRRRLNGGDMMTIGPAWRHPTAWAVAAIVLLLPTTFLALGSVLAYQLGLDRLRATLDPVLTAVERVGVLDALLVSAPALALLLAVAPMVRVGVVRADGASQAVVSVRALTLNVVAAAASLAIGALLVGHAIAELTLRIGA